MDSTELTSQQAIERFIKAAKAYCSLIEEPPSPPAEQLDKPPMLPLEALARIDIAQRLSASLCELYTAAHYLPNLDTEQDDLDVRLSQEQLAPLTSSLAQRLLPFDFFLLMFDPFETTKTEPVGASITLILMEIYEDIKEGLILVEELNAVADAVFEWHLGFYSNWGLHAAESIRALRGVMGI